MYSDKGIYMLQLLPQSNTIRINSVTADSAISTINKHIEEHFCESLCVDISAMNIIDACYVSTMCSTMHFIKYPQGKISWKVSSDKIEEFTNSLSLGNSDYHF
jgi:hypothetical protein